MKRIVLVFLVMLIGCAHQSDRKSSGSRTIEKSAAVLALEQKMRDLREKRENDRDRAALLGAKQKTATGGVLLRPKVGVNQSQVARSSVLSKWSQLPEFDLYREVLNAHDANDEIGFRLGAKTFLKKFPKSSLFDDVIYLSGLMFLSNRNYGAALKDFNLVLTKYKTSNRAGPALFAKGVVLKRMNLNTQAQAAFTQVKIKFAGSPEALRAESELKLLR